MRRKEGWTSVGIRADARSRGGDTAHDRELPETQHKQDTCTARSSGKNEQSRMADQMGRWAGRERQREIAMETNDAPEGQRHPTQEPGRLPQSGPAPSTHTRATGHGQHTSRQPTSWNQAGSHSYFLFVFAGPRGNVSKRPRKSIRRLARAELELRPGLRPGARETNGTYAET